MVEKSISEEKIVADDGVSSIEAPVTGEGGEVEKRLADLDKEVDSNADTLKTDTPVEGGGEVKKRLADLDKQADPKADTIKEATDKEDDEEESDEEESDDSEEESGDKEDEKEEVKESEESKAILTMFEGIDLSDDTKRKITMVFEAAVEYKANALAESIAKDKIDALSEEYATKYADHAKKVDEDVKVFMEETAKEWLEENKIAMEAASKVVMAEALIESIKDIFVENKVSIDGDTSLVIEGLEEELKEATKATEQVMLENANITKELNEMKKEAIFAEITEGLTVSQAEKLRSLSGKIVMENIDAYKADILTIKESFFPSNNAPAIKEEKEEIGLINENKEPTRYSSDPTVDSIIQAINARKK